MFGQAQRRPTSQPAPSPPPPARTGIKIDVKGSFDGQNYTNKPLGLSMILPQGWEPQDTETQRQLAEKVDETVHDRSGGTAAAQASVSRTAILFILVRPTEGRTNPTILGMVEDIALAFNVRTPTQYLMAARAIAEKSPLVFDNHVTTETINGVEFAWLVAVPKDPSSSARQRYYVTLRRNHAISFVVTYHGDDELKSGMEVLHSLKFE